MSDGNPLVGLLVVLGMGLVGLLMWRRLAPALAGAGLRAEQTSVVTGWLGVVGIAVQFVSGWVIVQAFPGEHDLQELLLMQLGAALLGVGAVLVVMSRRPEGVAALGLRRSRAPSALLVALAAWLAFYPVFIGVAAVNSWMLDTFAHGGSLQEQLRLFLADPEARSSPVAWSLIVLLLPATEELLFRGALYGALRRALHPALAIAFSAILFGAVHDPSARLPATALGVMLALLYERTGSLAAPLAFHALHNGVTLALATLLPGQLT